MEPSDSQVARLYQQVGQRIRETRGRKLTQAALAKKVSLSRTSITNIEKGRQKIFLHTFSEIAAALGVDPIDLLPSPGRSEDNTLEEQIPADFSVRTRHLIARAIQGHKSDKSKPQTKEK